MGLNKKELQALIDQNNALIKEVENSADSLRVVVVKLIPECEDQFYLNGDFVVDEEHAVYKAYKLNPAETVLFKAGKEVARRMYELDIEALKETIAKDREAENIHTTELRDSKQLLNDLKKKFEDHLKSSNEIIEQLTETKETQQSIIHNLQNVVTTLEAEKAEQTVEFRQKLSTVLSENNSMKIDNVGYCTQYGIILEE